MSFPKCCSDEEGMDEQAFPTVFFWLFSKVWHQTWEVPEFSKQFGAESRSAQKQTGLLLGQLYTDSGEIETEYRASGWGKWS